MWPKQKQKRTPRKPTKSDPPQPSASAEPENGPESSEEGINDLMNLDRVVIQNALIERGYHPAIIRRLDHNYCVFLLRESQDYARGPQKKGNEFTTLRSAKQRKTKNPFFQSRAEVTATEDE
jgi:hypothetical protein